MRSISSRKPSRSNRLARVLQRVLGEHDHEARGDAAALSAQDPAHALDHLPSGPARAHHHAEVGVRHVDAFVEHAGRGDGIERSNPEIVEDLAPLPPGGGTRDQFDRDERIEPVDRVIRRAHRLGEHERALRVLDRRGEAAHQLVLPGRLGDDLAPLGERVEVLARRPTVGARVPLRQVRDRGEEVAEGFEWHVADAAQMLPRADESVLDRDVLRTFSVRERDAHERDARAGAHTVGNRLLESVSVTDAAEERQEQVGDRVVAALQRRGEPEPFLVLRGAAPVAASCRRGRDIRRR